MSKEQTPIENLKEWLNEVTFEGKIMVRDMFIIEKLYKFFDDEEEYRKQYANTKVLEALEREFSKVDISMFDEDRSSDYIEQGKFYYETEVKPKYKK